MVTDVAQNQCVFTVMKFLTTKGFGWEKKKSVGHVAVVFCTIISVLHSGLAL